jgi:hypothetical protein
MEKIRRVQVPLTPEVARVLAREHEIAARMGIKLSDAAALVAVLTRAAGGLVQFGEAPR